MTSALPKAGTVLDQPNVWQLLNHVARRHPGISAATNFTTAGVDFLTLLALTRAVPPVLAFVDRWDPRRAAPITVTGPDHLNQVGLQLTRVGAAWLAEHPPNTVLQYLAVHGGRAHLSSLLGADVGDVAVLDRLRGIGAVTIRHTTAGPLPTITDTVLPQCRHITVTLTDLGDTLTGRT